MNCRRFDANQVRPQLHVLAYNLANFQMAEVAVSRHLYRTILRRIARLREVALPPPAG